MYEDFLAFEEALGGRFEWILHVGDFGVWPNPDRCDRATRCHDGAGDFPVWWPRMSMVADFRGYSVNTASDPEIPSPVRNRR